MNQIMYKWLRLVVHIVKYPLKQKLVHYAFESFINTN